LTVSALDAHGKRQLGPFVSSRLMKTLEKAGMWSANGLGTRSEQQLAEKCLRSGRGESEAFCNEICVFSTPLALFGKPCGAIVYGWVFNTFATGLCCERIAAQHGLIGAKLWREARLEQPVPLARMETYRALLDTMISSTIQQLENVERLHQLARMREVFLAGVSHELRSPLSAISLRLDALLLTPLERPEQLRPALKIMKAHVALEARLIEDLIDAARTRTGQLTVKPEPVSLVKVLEGALAAVQPQADSKQVAIDAKEVETHWDVVVHADTQRLQQLFWNLLFNAVKFTPAGGTVRIGIKRDPVMHEIAVHDNGRGIEPQFLPHIFDAFRKRQQDNAPGLGLGLFLAKHIAELHGGSIRAASPGLGQGATFTVSLPASSVAG
jgi:signal transduction histidine kinase